MSKAVLSVAIMAATLAGCGVEPAAAQVPAFPGAEGAGAYSLGGRGGRVFHVTTLEDGGPGSLRAAVEAKGPRIVVFDLGGTIRLDKPLTIRNPRITIAGQTAPGGGITLRDQGFRVMADDVVVRFIRSRLGDLSNAVSDSIWVAKGRDIILDHVSASWSTDEALSVSSSFARAGDLLDGVTVQWSIIADSLCSAKNPQGRHCYGTIAATSRGGRISFLHNLWANHGARMPRPANYLPSGKDREGGIFDFRNNVMYNWAGRSAGYNSSPAARVAYNFVGNSYWTGPDSKGDALFEERDPFATAWFSGNSLNGRPLGDDWKMVIGGGRPGYRRQQPAAITHGRAMPAATAYAQVLAHAGASLVRDLVDAQVVAGVRSRTGRLIDSQTEVGGWPDLARGTPWRDSDSDGMPDEWERAHRLDPGDGADGRLDGDRDGYTNVEEWLHERAAPAMG